MDGIKEKINTVLSKYPVVDNVFTNLSEKRFFIKLNSLQYSQLTPEAMIVLH